MKTLLKIQKQLQRAEGKAHCRIKLSLFKNLDGSLVMKAESFHLPCCFHEIAIPESLMQQETFELNFFLTNFFNTFIDKYNEKVKETVFDDVIALNNKCPYCFSDIEKETSFSIFYLCGTVGEKETGMYDKKCK